MLIADLAFYVFAFALVMASLMVVTLKNPVYSVLFLIFAFFNAAALFVMLGAEFIAMLLVIVYVGAVAVLFLFVVMMLNIDLPELKSSFSKYLPLGIVFAAVMLVELWLVITTLQTGVGVSVAKSALSQEIVPSLSNTEAIGMVLYTKYLYPFELAGVVLLVAMVGAIVLTLREREGVKRQNITKQFLREKSDCIEIVKVDSSRVQ